MRKAVRHLARLGKQNRASANCLEDHLHPLPTTPIMGIPLPEGDCIPFRNVSGPGVLLMRVEMFGKELKTPSREGKEEKTMRFNALQQGQTELADSHLDSCLRRNDELRGAWRFISQV